MLPDDVEALAGELVLTMKTALAPVLARMAALEAHLDRLPAHDQVLTELRERLVAVETKTAIPAALPAPVDLTPVLERVAAISERVAVVETRAPIPGPPGPNGKDGVDGKDGADGLGFDDFEEVIGDDERTITHRYRSGDRVKEFVYKTSTEIYRGVYVEGKTYDRGDVVTWGGSSWHCNETTTSKPGDSKAWQLQVKKGRDGKDGLDAPGALPVVTVGRR